MTTKTTTATKATALSSALQPQQTLAPLTTVDAADHEQEAPTVFGAECPTCGKGVLNGAIVTTSSASWSGATGWSIERTLFCSHCDHLVSWRQACNNQGEQFGERVTDPVISKDQKRVEHFLKKYPQAKGVL